LAGSKGAKMMIEGIEEIMALEKTAKYLKI